MAKYKSYTKQGIVWKDEAPDTTYWRDYRSMLWSCSWFLLIPVFGWIAFAFIALIGPGKRM